MIVGCSKNSDKKEYVFQGMTMGTTYSIKIVTPFTTASEVDVKQAIKDELAGVNKLMSTFDPNSEVSRFNQHGSTEWFPVSKETYQVIKEALRISKETDGAMDITVGKLVNIWGFGKDRQKLLIPNENEIETLKQQSGFRYLQLNDEKKEVKKTLPALYVDLASIAKGYGVDRVSQRLLKMGFKNFLVEIGGEIRTFGYKNQSSKKLWVLAVEKPLSMERTIFKKLYMKSRALATSGDYRNYFEKNGVRFSHTINPKTGYPIKHHLASVSVIHSSCMTADGLATALMVMGAKEGYQWALNHKIAAYFIYRSENGFEEMVTPDFQPYFEKNRKIQ